jgi:hypothetical protein
MTTQNIKAELAPIDEEVPLTPSDVALLKRRLWKSILTTTAVVLGIVVVGMITGFPMTPFAWKMVFAVWFFVVALQFLRTRYLLDRRLKKILRGEIAQRFESDPGDDGSPSCVFYINGKRMVVPPAIFATYFTRDVAEFHYIDDLILQHKLLKRGEKEYV